MDFVNARSAARMEETALQFKNGIHYALTQDPHGEMRFDSLKSKKVMLVSPDKQIRIFTWDVRSADLSHTSFGFLQAYNKKSKQYELYELKDRSESVRDPENTTLDCSKWYGAYYFSISEKKYKKKKYYILLGWDGNNQSTNKKLIEILSINDKGFPKFGADPVLSDEKGKFKKRIIFEYKAGLVMSLRFDEEKDGILFDHLSPSETGLEGVYSFYGPDFTYDMLHFKDGKWQYVKNVDARNEKERTDKYFNSPK